MADKIRVDTACLRGWANDLSNVSDALGDAARILGGVNTSDDWWRKVGFRRTLSLRDEGRSESLTSARGAVSQLRSALNRYERNVNKLSGAVRQASVDFAETESEIKAAINAAGEGGNAGIYANGGAAVAGAQAALEYLKQQIKEGKWEDISWGTVLTTVISAFGVGGEMIGGTLDLAFKVFGGSATGGDVLKYLANSGKSIVDWVKMDANYKKLSNLGQDYANKLHDKEFLGLKKYLKTPSKSTNGWTAFKTNFSKGFKSGVTSKASWIVSGIVSTIDNVEQVRKGEISGDRAVVETIVETGTSVVMGAAAAAATGAAFVAAGVSAPAVAVVAVSGLAVAGIDYVWKNTLGDGKGIVESAGAAVGWGYDQLKGWANSTFSALWAN